MSEPKVAVLISTYNGEKYIQEQLDSILNQSYKNIEIYVRDDGSKDNTVNILKKYKDKIKLVEGENVGFNNSFYELLTYPKDCKYYSFCDQDDVWLQDKIERAVNTLEKMDNEKMLLYASNYAYYDSNMNYLRESNYKNKDIKFYKTIIEAIAPGMTMVVNNKVRDELLTNTPKVKFYHDWWISLICSSMGEVFFDNKVVVKHRIHDNNVTEKHKGIVSQLTESIRTFLGNSFWKKLRGQFKEFYRIYSDKLNEDDKKVADLFNRRSIINQAKKVFYNKRFKNNLKDELFMRFYFLIWKI